VVREGEMVRGKGRGRWVCEGERVGQVGMGGVEGWVGGYVRGKGRGRWVCEREREREGAMR